MKFAKSCGEPGFGCAPTFASVSRTCGEFSPLLIAALSLSTMLAGVPAGAITRSRTS